MRKSRASMIEETRAKLIEAAREAFGSQGYAQASMDELTAKAGLTRGALYHHFGGKPGLLAAVVAQMDAEMDARLEQVLADHADPWEGSWPTAVPTWPWRRRARYAASCCRMRAPC